MEVTHKPAKPKHRKVEEFQEVPLPRSVGEERERYEEKPGTTKAGCLLRGPSGYCTEPMERHRAQTLFRDPRRRQWQRRGSLLT